MADVFKKREWAFVVYPDSLPDDWLDILKLSGLQIAISPYHDKDFNPDGSPKKPHYHVIIVYNGPTTYKNVSRFTSKLNGTIPIELEAVKGMYRYFTHLDNPEKYQYNDSDIIHLNGFDLSSLVPLTSSEIEHIKDHVISFIEDNDIYEYYDLIKILKAFDLSHELHIAKNHTIFFNTYLTSKRNKFKEMKINNSEVN